MVKESTPRPYALGGMCTTDRAVTEEVRGTAPPPAHVLLEWTAGAYQMTAPCSSTSVTHTLQIHPVALTNCSFKALAVAYSSCCVSKQSLSNQSSPLPLDLWHCVLLDCCKYNRSNQQHIDSKQNNLILNTKRQGCSGHMYML